MEGSGIVSDTGGRARYSYGGDDHLFVEVSEEMSLLAYFKAIAMTRALAERRLPGIVDICSANASFQVLFDPDDLHPRALREIVEEIEDSVGDISAYRFDTRVIEVPVLYDDPWTNETLLRFRDRHQEPEMTDLEYGAEVNGFDSAEDFIAAHHGSPWFTSMVGFVAGLPFLYQMVERERQLQVPKYLRPRTDTPALTIGHGGCFGCIYSVRGAGGYQMFGITPLPIYDPRQEHAGFDGALVLFQPGDIVKFTRIDRARYDELRGQVEAGTVERRVAPLTFELDRFLADSDAYNTQVTEALDGS